MDMKRKVYELPTALLGEIVGYLDITSDVFFPQWQSKWERQSRIVKNFFTAGKEAFLEHNPIGVGRGSFHDTPTLVSGTIQWVNGLIHSLHDEPAIVLKHGTRKWARRGQIHRGNDLPAIEYANGDKQWYQNGQLHRGHDEPAHVCTSGKEFWYTHGEYKWRPWRNPIRHLIS